MLNEDKMKNTTALLSSLITANHILSHHAVLDPFGHISVRNPNTNTTFFIALQIGPATVSSPADIGEYNIADGTPLPGTVGGYAERYIHSEILKRYPDVNVVVHSHSEDVLPYTVLNSAGDEDEDGDGKGDGKGMRGMQPVYHMAGFLGGEVPNFDIGDVYEEGEPRDMLVNSVRLGGALAEMFGRNETRVTLPLHTTVLMRG